VWFRFVTDNAWSIAEIGFGVTGLVLAGMAVGRYISLFAKLVPTVFITHSASTGTSLPTISLRTAQSASSAHRL